MSDSLDVIGKSIVLFAIIILPTMFFMALVGLVGFVGLLIGIFEGILLLTILHAWRERAGNGSIQSTNLRPVLTQKEVEREVVKIRCPHCRTLNPDGNSNCFNCGARL